MGRKKGNAYSEHPKERQVLALLHQKGRLSRMEIAAALHMTKAAVTLLVNEMLAQGILLEHGEYQPQDKKARRGRKRILLGINENHRLVFGAALEQDRLQIGLTNLKGETLDRVSVPLEQNTYRQVLEQIVGQTEQFMKANCITSDQLLAIGIAVSQSGRHWIDGAALSEKLARIKTDLSRALTLPIAAGTAAEGAARAQQVFAQTPSHFITVRYGRTPEAALVIDGKIYRGATEKAGGLSGKRAVDGLHPERMAAWLKNVSALLDPGGIFLFGGLMETGSGLAELDELLADVPVIRHSLVTDDTLYLAGCGCAVSQFLFGG